MSCIHLFNIVGASASYAIISSVPMKRGIGNSVNNGGVRDKDGTR